MADTDLNASIKFDYFSDPESFRDFALNMVEHDSFESLFGGNFELRNHGEKTMWIDEQSMQEILCAMKSLKSAVMEAKIVCKSKAHLTVIK